ncbi:nicotinate-nucleotide adenylyltransferase [Rhodovarius lipocyclicus]|uniref:nicotinate-nucleotide adenylyltransferase n=1 Tax=Rhodovarius lipocyclicus TaxID=268410 RepID=UPI0013572505|nr:nicotinate-nucleotide adenylyltransferase [Rhodovarius lipocyclicus]
MSVGDRRRARIGLLGGSFNPAHHGHAHVARVALAALRLDAVWLMVSPGNPLKPARGMAPFAERMASARAVAAPPRIVASDVEARLGTRLTWRTLRLLRARFPRVEFVLIIGADNLVQLPRWGRWRQIAADTRLAVLPRPGSTRAALHGRAASVLRRHRRAPGAIWSGKGPHAPWCFVPARLHAASATAIRSARWRSAADSGSYSPS